MRTEAGGTQERGEQPRAHQGTKRPATGDADGQFLGKGIEPGWVHDQASKGIRWMEMCPSYAARARRLRETAMVSAPR